MAYALYLRKSRADEELGHENTLARHEEMLRDLADKNNIYVDEAHIYREIVSGESIEARPQMQRLLKAAEPERDIKRIPVLSKALDEYWGLDSESRNRLLKGMAERVEYEKTERGTGLEPRIRATLRI
mgnify:CR=1 FL=1|nr:MAG TPA: integrase [Caudoviricetes sp.]